MDFLVDRRSKKTSTSPLRIKAVGGNILRASEHTVLVEAGSLITQVREEAARILASANGAYEAERERGYAEGQHAALQEKAAMMLALINQRDTYLKGVETEVVELVMALVRKILNDFNDKEKVLKVVGTGLALLRQQKHVVLRVNAADIETVRESLSALLSAFPGIEYIDVAADDRFEPGSCRLETEMGTVQTSLTAQLEIVEQALRQALVRPTLAEEEVHA